MIAAADIANLFTAPLDYGADGAGSVAYTLDATGGLDTGLYLTGDTTDEIKLVAVAGGYEGQTSNGTVAFSVLVTQNTTTGEDEITVTQNETLEHLTDGSTPADHNDALDINGLISVVQTITDGDGDTDSATSESALEITFLDDGPDAVAQTGATASAELDETDFATGTPGEDSAVIAAADIANLFTAPLDYGADGAGSVAYTLDATGGLDTGLYLTGDTTDEIKLVAVAGGYEGQTSNGTVAFSVLVTQNTTTGEDEITVTQNETLEHLTDGSTPADHNDALDINGLISVVQTITDGDGDTDSATSESALEITFLDDGPTQLHKQVLQPVPNWMKQTSQQVRQVKIQQ